MVVIRAGVAARARWWWHVLRMPRARLRLALACAVALLRAAWQVRRWPFARLAAILGVVGQEGPVTVGAPCMEVARQVRWAVNVWRRHWPYTPTCLMQGVAAQRLLARRGVGSTLYFGVRVGEAGGAGAAGPMAAHAWLRVGPMLVTGGEEAPRFKVVATYYLDPRHG